MLLKYFFLGITFLPNFAQAKMTLIANPELQIKPKIEDIRRLYLGKDKTLGGQLSIEAIDIDSSSPLRRTFLDQVLLKSEEQLNQYWSRLIFTGKALPPRRVGGDEAVIEWVAKNKTAVGVVDSSSLSNEVRAVFTFAE